MQLVKKKKEKKLFNYDIFELIGFDFYNNQRVRSCFFVESYVDDTWMDNGLVYFSCVSDVTESLVFSKKFYNAVGVYDELVLLCFVRQKFYYLSGYSGYEYNFLPRITLRKKIGILLHPFFLSTISHYKLKRGYLPSGNAYFLSSLNGKALSYELYGHKKLVKKFKGFKFEFFGIEFFFKQRWLNIKLYYHYNKLSYFLRKAEYIQNTSYSLSIGLRSFLYSWILQDTEVLGKLLVKLRLQYYFIIYLMRALNFYLSHKIRKKKRYNKLLFRGLILYYLLYLLYFSFIRLKFLIYICEIILELKKGAIKLKQSSLLSVSVRSFRSLGFLRFILFFSAVTYTNVIGIKLFWYSLFLLFIGYNLSSLISRKEVYFYNYFTFSRKKRYRVKRLFSPVRGRQTILMRS
jgi:hypothetical protein